MVIINSPNNPTGAVIPPAEFERIYEVCRKREIWLMTDECYSHFTYAPAKPYSIASIDGSKPHIIVIGSLSKTFAMTGWRIGYTLAPKPLIDAINKLQSQSTSNPTSIAQYAALAALTGPMDSVPLMLAEYARRRTRILAGLRAIAGVTCSEPSGAFYAFPDISARLGEGTPDIDRPGAAVARTPECRGRSGRRLRSAGLPALLLRHVDRAHRRRTAPPDRLLLRCGVGQVKLAPSRLAPLFVPRIWGARKLEPLFDVPPGPEPIGEVWLTGEQCAFASGPFAGRPLGEVWPSLTPDWTGTRIRNAPRIPLLVKFLFPEDKLSVQVHPSDDYARAHESGPAPSARPRCGTSSPRAKAPKSASDSSPA